MTEEPNSHDEKLARVLKELTLIRYLLGFVAVCVGIILFIPQLAAYIASVSVSLQESLIPFMSGIVGFIFILAIVILGGAFIVSKVAPTLDYNQENKEKSRTRRLS